MKGRFFEYNVGIAGLLGRDSMKICVYAICKDEAQFVSRWVDSMSEADEIYVLDTGSTDQTVALLKERGVIVEQKVITPWRFDVARNESLKLVPEDCDVCVCTDLDEVLEPGWRQVIEKLWKKGVTRGHYRYTWSFNEDGTEGSVFDYDKIHTRQHYRWTHPVHEVLEYLGEGMERVVYLTGIQLNHYPDRTKSRGQYLPLLELSVKENPNDDRNVHYLGREYFYYNRYDEAITTLKRHLSLPTATWDAERAASMRYIAKSYAALKEPEMAKTWFFKAIKEAPYLREGYIQLALQFYKESDWFGVAYAVENALKIKERPLSYITDPSSWDATPYDLGAISQYYLGNYEQALIYAQLALNCAPQNKRLKANYELIAKALK